MTALAIVGRTETDVILFCTFELSGRILARARAHGLGCRRLGRSQSRSEQRTKEKSGGNRSHHEREKISGEQQALPDECSVLLFDIGECGADMQSL